VEFFVDVVQVFVALWGANDIDIWPSQKTIKWPKIAGIYV